MRLIRLNSCKKKNVKYNTIGNLTVIFDSCEAGQHCIQYIQGEREYRRTISVNVLDYFYKYNTYNVHTNFNTTTLEFRFKGVKKTIKNNIEPNISVCVYHVILYIEYLYY